MASVAHEPGFCGSEPAREDGGTSSIGVTDIPLSRAGSLPQGSALYLTTITTARTQGIALFFVAFTAWARSLVGAGLSGRRIAAMVVNDNAGELDERGPL